MLELNKSNLNMIYDDYFIDCKKEMSAKIIAKWYIARGNNIPNKANNIFDMFNILMQDLNEKEIIITPEKQETIEEELQTLLNFNNIPIVRLSTGFLCKKGDSSIFLFTSIYKLTKRFELILSFKSSVINYEKKEIIRFATPEEICQVYNIRELFKTNWEKLILKDYLLKTHKKNNYASNE